MTFRDLRADLTRDRISSAAHHSAEAFQHSLSAANDQCGAAVALAIYELGCEPVSFFELNHRCQLSPLQFNLAQACFFLAKALACDTAGNSDGCRAEATVALGVLITARREISETLPERA